MCAAAPRSNETIIIRDDVIKRLRGVTWPNVTGKDGQWNAEQRCCAGVSCADSGY